MTAAMPQLPLSTSGRYLVDARGRRVDAPAMSLEQHETRLSRR
jgi:hypothetical protein